METRSSRPKSRCAVGDGDVGRVVDVEAEELPLRLEDADDEETEAADPDPPAEGRRLAEELRFSFGPRTASGAPCRGSPSGRNRPCATW